MTNAPLSDGFAASSLADWDFVNLSRIIHPYPPEGAPLGLAFEAKRVFQFRSCLHLLCLQYLLSSAIPSSIVGKVGIVGVDAPQSHFWSWDTWDVSRCDSVGLFLRMLVSVMDKGNLPFLAGGDVLEDARIP